MGSNIELSQESQERLLVFDNGLRKGKNKGEIMTADELPYYFALYPIELFQWICTFTVRFAKGLFYRLTYGSK